MIARFSDSRVTARSASAALSAALVLGLGACFLDATGEQPAESGGAAPTGGTSSSHGAGGAGAFSPDGGAGGMSTITTGGGGAGGGTTSTGGSDCGDGDVDDGEQCDAGAANGPFNGCNVDCTLGPHDDCAGVTPLDLVAGKTIVVTGTTEGALDDIVLNSAFAGLACPSDGSDVWIGVHVVEAGAVRATLTVGPGGAWGSSQEKGVLQLRTGCDATEAAEVLVCKSTADGVAETRFFAQANQLVYFVVDGRGNADAGPFTLEIEQFVCGDGTTQPPEQCDEGAATATCQACLSTNAIDACGTDDADSASIFLSQTGHCYVREAPGNRNFFEARAACVEMGGDLASLSSTIEKTAFDTLLKLNDLAWVGLEDFEIDTPYSYDWLDGVAFTGPWEAPNPDSGDTKPRCGGLRWTDATTSNTARDAFCDSDAPSFVCELHGTNP